MLKREIPVSCITGILSRFFIISNILFPIKIYYDIKKYFLNCFIPLRI